MILVYIIEYGNSIVFVKTHLEGILKRSKSEKESKTKRKYEINEG